MPNRNVMNQTDTLSTSISSPSVVVGARATAAAALSVAVLATALCTAGPAAAAQSLGSFKHWAAHADGKDAEKVCWIYSEPQKDEGNYTRRGRIYALVTHRPGENVANQVQFTAGYPFKEGSPANPRAARRPRTPIRWPARRPPSPQSTRPAESNSRVAASPGPFRRLTITLSRPDRRG